MNKYIILILSILAGIVSGSIVNMAVLHAGTNWLIPLPPGADVSTTEALAASIQMFEPRHFISPFLAHALGTLSGSFVSAMLFRNATLRAALPVGIVFLAGGIYMVNSIPSPAWFNFTDLALAYIPMAYAGAAIAGKIIISKGMQTNRF